MNLSLRYEVLSECHKSTVHQLQPLPPLNQRHTLMKSSSSHSQEFHDQSAELWHLVQYRCFAMQQPSAELAWSLVLQMDQCMEPKKREGRKHCLVQLFDESVE